MSNASVPEAWQRGPVAGVPPLLMPVAHALIQAREDAERALTGLSIDQIWMRPAGAASVGFHVRHLGGALDRLFTYARGESLSDEQRRRIPIEGIPGEPAAGAADLLADLDERVGLALAQVQATPESTLLDARGIGRQQLPSTVIGLLFHGAEHAIRHAGQAITTARIVKGDG
jgi:DinB superfamily